MISRKIVYQNAVTIDHNQWFWSENYNALYKRNLEMGTIQRMSPYKKSKTAAYTKLVFYKNKLIALPYAADKIMIFNIQSEEIRYSDIGIPELQGNSSNLEKFYGVVIKENWLFMIGCKTAHILKFDMEKEVTVGYVDLYLELLQKENGIGYLRDGIAFEDKIVIPALYENCVFEIDIESLKYKKKQLDKSGIGFSTVFKTENDVWLLPFDEGEIIRWNKSNSAIQKYNMNYLMNFRKGVRNFLSVQQYDQKLWLIPRFGNKIISYDLTTNQFSNMNAVNTYFNSIDKEWFGTADEMNGRDIWILPEYLNEIILFNVEKNEIHLINNEMPWADHLEFLKNKGEKLVLFEHEVQLKEFLKFVCRI